MVKVRVEGRRKAAAKAAPQVRARPVVAPHAKPTVASLMARIEALEARVTQLEAPVVVDLAAVKQAALATVADLDARDRLGGLVPIPDLRAALRGQGIADDAAVTAALEQLEQEWRIDLNVAQSPSTVADRGAGIERAGRGLLYYVSRRSG